MIDKTVIDKIEEKVAALRHGVTLLTETEAIFRAVGLAGLARQVSEARNLAHSRLLGAYRIQGEEDRSMEVERLR